MDGILKSIYRVVKSGMDYTAYRGLRDMCRECMKEDIPLAIKYSISIEGIALSTPDAHPDTTRQGGRHPLPRRLLHSVSLC